MTEIVQFKGIDPEEVLKRGQPLRTAVVETMLKQHGFERKRQTGSHITFFHEKTGLTEVLVNSSTNLAYQRSAARACMKVRAAIVEAQLDFINAKNSFSGNLSDEFGCVDIVDILPDSLKYETYSESPDCIVLRSLQYPQCGVLLPKKMNEQSWAGILRTFKEREIDFENILKRYADYGCDYVRASDGSITISSDFAEIDVTLDVFDPSVFQDPINDLDFFYQGIESHICISKALLDSVDEKRKIKESDTHIFWEITDSDFLDCDTYTSEIVTDKSENISRSDFFDFLQKRRTFNFGGPEDRKRVQRLLAEHYGIIIRKPKKAGELQGSHPFYKDMDFSYSDINSLPSFSALYKRLVSAETGLEIADLWDNIMEVLNTITDASVTIHTAILCWQDQLEAVNEKNSSIAERYKLMPFVFSYVEPGKIGEVHISLPNPQASKFIMRYMIVQNSQSDDNEYISLLHPDDVDKLEQALIVSGPNQGLNVLQHGRE